ncbi:unnamed protein product [Miscanthus lutarioriparius]|uniref:F-box domain-containing protein n=1 Tax=Miscanthus lutarioriparius TaxID=422564 RepID=A0A811RHK7_9POAL|nr:unnamed protein product [Miscanthus lutarioriparius]
MAARPNRRRPLCLTDLPDEVVLEILLRLDIRDAVRTSTLSLAWRHRWRHLPVLDFKRCSFGRLGVVSATQSVLLRHHAQSYKLHSSIFSFIKLEYLDLKGCLLPDSTPGLVASLPLVHLIWLRVHYTRAQFHALAALISGCLGPKQLAVIVAPGVAGVTLKIAAPLLRHLEIRARSANWIVEFQSLLPDLPRAKLVLPFYRYAQEGGSKLLYILQGISRVEALELLDGSPLVDFQAMVPFKIPTKFENLQYLTTDADLGDAVHIVFIFEFLRCCPNLIKGA